MRRIRHWRRSGVTHPPAVTATAGLARTGVLLVLACLVAAVGVPLTAPRAEAATEEIPVPSNGVIQLEGQGWGHGVGMSQYGANQGAALGRSATQILAAYYPGAALTAAPTAPVRVQLSRWDGRATCTSSPASAGTCLEVLAEPGQVFTNVPTGARVNAPTSIGGVPVTSLAVGATASGLTLWAKAGSWRQVNSTTYAGPIDITSADGVQVGRASGSDRSYRGRFRVVRESSSTIRRINVVSMEDYLLGVVPAEMPASWATAAVQAQAVAARTYAAASMRTAGSRSYDLCDTTSCQVYGGVASENATATTKIRSATPSDVRGRILTSGGVPITAFFASSNGGWSISGGSSWLPARADTWDPASRWTRSVAASCLAGKYPGRGNLTRIVIAGRNGQGAYGGRVTSLRFVFTGGTVTVGPGNTPMATDSAIRASMLGCGDSAGLRSSLFRAVPAPTPPQPPTLGSGQTLTSGQRVASPNGQFQLAVDPATAGTTRPGLAVTSRTCPDVQYAAASAPGSRLAMQGDGNLVLYQGSTVLWHTRTFGHPGATTLLDSDGRLIVRDSSGATLWASAASCTTAYAYEQASRYAATRSPRPATLLPGDRLLSADRSTQLAMQGDGNLVLYRNGSPLWHSRTPGNPGASAVLQGDGNLVVYASTGRALFNTRTVWPANPGNQTDETLLRVTTGKLTIIRVVRNLDTGAQVSAATGWSAG